MFGLGKTHPELEAAANKLRMNMQNNYKDAAQADFAALTEKFEKLKAAGKLSKRQLAYYEPVMDAFRGELKGYTHKDQNARWMG